MQRLKVPSTRSLERIVENQAKIEALWLSKLATIVKDKIQKAKKKDKKKAND